MIKNLMREYFSLRSQARNVQEERRRNYKECEAPDEYGKTCAHYLDVIAEDEACAPCIKRKEWHDQIKVIGRRRTVILKKVRRLVNG